MEFPNCFENCGNVLFGDFMATKSEGGGGPRKAFSSPVTSPSVPHRRVADLDDVFQESQEHAERVQVSKVQISPEQRAKSMAVALYDAVSVDDIGICESILNESPELVNLPDAQGWAAIHYAAACGSVCSAKVLLRYGADMHQVTSNNKTPMVLAAEQKRASVLQFFLRVNVADRGRQSSRRQLDPPHANAAISQTSLQPSAPAVASANNPTPPKQEGSAGTGQGGVQRQELPLDTPRGSVAGQPKSTSTLRKPLSSLKQNLVSM